jgi:thioredoxin-related protein
VSLGPRRGVPHFQQKKELNLTFFDKDTENNDVISFISPSCEHCHYQTQALLSDHAKRPTGLRLAFIADGHPDSLKVFASKFEYDTTTTRFIWDEESKLAQEMGVTSYPTMFLYDTAGVHLQTIVGEAKPGYVYKFFHDTE